MIPSTLPQQFKGRRCQLHVFIGNAPDVGDVEFEP